MSFLDNLWRSLSRMFPGRGRRSAGAIQGSRESIALGASRQRIPGLPVPDVALRPIEQSLDVSYDLLEMSRWSYEVKNGLEFLARDVFCENTGRVGSWSIGTDLETGREPHPRVKEIAADLAKRYSGKKLVLGGDRLARAVIESSNYGDSCLELAIEKEGIGRNDYCISRSLFIPPLSVFIDEEEDGTLNGYWQRQRTMPSEGDRYLHPVKTLWFSRNPVGMYGSPSILPSVPIWRKLKEASADLQDAARATGITPWIHVMPEDRGEDYKETYKQEYLSLQQDGIVTDLFLSHGADVRKAMGDSSIQSLIDHWLQLRYNMVPPGIPLWFYPGLGMDKATGKELANQPAMAYARMISSIRGMLGEQIRWTLNLEILLKEGYEFMMENRHYDILWPKWEVLPVTDNQSSMFTDEQEQNGATVDERGTVRSCHWDDDALNQLQDRHSAEDSLESRIRRAIASPDEVDHEELRSLDYETLLNSSRGVERLHEELSKLMDSEKA